MLYVRGQNAVTPETGNDVLLAYSHFVQAQKPLPGQLRDGRLAPHVRFANAATDEDLIRFVREYGPVNGKWNAPGPLAKDRTTIEAVENLQRLRREQRIFASVLNLMGCLKDRNDTDTANALGDLMDACLQQAPSGDSRFEQDAVLELLMRSKPDGLHGNASGLEVFLRNLGGEQAREYGWYALCFLLSRFPPAIAPAKNGLVEIPQRSNAGILPALFFMVRRDCLLDNEIRICDRRDCGKFFKVERGGQKFCSSECSRLQRQRDYWATKGKEARAKRRKAKKRTKKGGRIVTV
jgi:hypothetical protein